MGGDVVAEEQPCSYPDLSGSSSFCSSDDSGCKDENIPKFWNHPADLSMRDKAYREILQSHDLLQQRLRSSKRNLKLARRQILRYTPGSWGHVNSSDYDIPKTTSIILVGPKGAGKSCLVNRITRVIQDDDFAPPRAQESYGSHSEGGTFFVQEYMIPSRGSASFCLYDTRGLNQNSSSDFTSKIEQWLTRGVCHGQPVIWTSDSSDVRDRLVRDSGTGCEIRKVNSVIFVVNGVEVLKSMEYQTSYAQMISMAFNCPLLSFKDDKPAVVVTHGDILLWEERARVRVFLGELLGIPPHKQIFDIPECRDAATALTVCDLLSYSLEHADKNFQYLPKWKTTISKVISMVILVLPLLMILAMNYFHVLHKGQNVVHEHILPILQTPSRLYNLTSEAQAKRGHDNWVIRGPHRAHMPSLEPKSVPEGEPSINWHTARRLWFDEGKMAKAEPSFDWRTTRRLWYVE